MGADMTAMMNWLRTMTTTKRREPNVAPRRKAKAISDEVWGMSAQDALHVKITKSKKQ
jgi:hypothetical protein